jgi:hypothetical protein
MRLRLLNNSNQSFLILSSRLTLDPLPQGCPVPSLELGLDTSEFRSVPVTS